MLIKICNRIIEYSFYVLFLLVPLAFTSKTSELFELNKMWFTWGLTIIIVMAWLIKMVLQRRIIFQRTPLDLPILLFLLSQTISTIFSLDFHVSLWGYYSRFNGGLLSIISYILLYYAFLSNFIPENSEPRSAGSEHSENQKFRQSDNLNVRKSGIPSFPSVPNNNPIKMVRRLLFISLISGTIVALWGLPSHFGYDPTCLLFRGTFDVSCWTADFMPKIRIFSTLGQPNWLAAYLAILIPVAIAFWLQKTQDARKPKGLTARQSETLAIRVLRVFWNKQIFYLLLSALFYVVLLYTDAQSGFIAFWIANAFFWFFVFIKKLLSQKIFIKYLLIINFSFLIFNFFVGTPVSPLDKFTLKGIKESFTAKQTAVSKPQNNTEPVVNVGEMGGTDSGNIRLNVWSGAINAWKANPLFGTGVETFAFAYYKYKPISQNLTSEWNFLYNKAHNEYLNYLATTGIVGLGTYLLMIGMFLLITIRKLLFSENSEPRSAGSEHSENQKFRQSDNLNVRLSGTPSFPSILNISLLASYISILVTNFFGFSVVITNIYLFLIPAFIFVLTNTIKPKPSEQSVNSSAQINLSIWQWTSIFFILIACLLSLFALFRFWRADIAFALGYNLDRAGEYQQAYPNLHQAVKLRGDEPVFKDELSINAALLAAGLISQESRAAGIASGDARRDSDTEKQVISVASSLAQEAINISNEVISGHPNNTVFWKTRTRLFFTLSQADSRYLTRALAAIEKASLLAPQDANIWYNLGVLYGQNNNLEKGISALEKTIILKPDYRDAYYALGLFYHTASLDESGKKAVDENLNQKAISQMKYILNHISPEDSGAIQSIEDWSK